MEFSNSWTGNWHNAFVGLRHPMESYNRSDSQFGVIKENSIQTEDIINKVVKSYMEHQNEKVNLDQDKIKNDLINNGYLKNEYVLIGYNDLKLAQRMIKAGSPNDKFLRQIFVSVDITAPLYW